MGVFMDAFIRMSPIERVRAVQQVCAAIDDQLSWNDISIFFGRLGIKPPDMGDGSYTKVELIREYLVQVSDSALIDIGVQLGLAAPADTGIAGQLGDSKYWLTDHVRVFISHVHTIKKSAGNLRAAFQRYAISAFVAHDDIEPSDEWREQILRALASMDAFVVVLTPDFNSSKWTDQEVGVAVARDVLVIPLRKGEVPYGFIAKYQAFNAEGRSVGDVAEAVFRTLATSDKARERTIHCLTSTIASSANAEEAAFRVEKLNSVEGVTSDQWERIRENVVATPSLMESENFIEALNKILRANSLELIEAGKTAPPALDDEIPF